MARFSSAIPKLVAEKIVAHHKLFRNDRFLLQMAIGTMPHAQIMRGIELYGTKVAPLVTKGIDWNNRLWKRRKRRLEPLPQEAQRQAGSRG